MWPHAAGLLVVAGAMALLAPEPAYETDRGVYERMGQEWLVPGCNDFHCFRPLVSWVLGRLPGPPLVIWKVYAVLRRGRRGPRHGVLGHALGRLGVDGADGGVADGARIGRVLHVVRSLYA